jgi:superfamily II DNA or RNA helicase
MTAVEKIICEPTKAALNASLMGTGKTLMGVESAVRLGSKTVLIIGPLNTYWGWYDTIQRQTGYKSNVVKIDSTKDGKQAFDDLTAGKAGWYFIGREYFRTKDWAKVVPDVALVDECHFAQNRNSKSFKALKTLKAGYKLSMSGTPYGNKFEGFWAITRWLWPSLIPKSYWAWIQEWAKLAYSPFTKYDIAGELNPGAFAKSLPCYIRLEPAKAIEYVEEVRYVDLSPTQRKIYQKFEKDLVVWLKEHPMIAEVPVAARTRLRQITLAVPSISDEGEIYFEENAVSSKYKALMEIIEDHPTDPMLILTDSQKYAKIVVNRLNSHGEVAFEWSGQANQKEREQAKQRFLKKELKYIVAVIPAIAEGVDGLQDVCSTVVWLSHSDSNVLNQQVVDRIRRRGQNEIVKIYDIVARDTYDEGQLSSLVETQLKMNHSLRGGKDE